MNEIEYDWTRDIATNIKIMRFMGLWPSGKTYRMGFYMIYSGCLITIFVICHISSQIINIYFVHDNFESFVGTLYILLIELVASCKVYYVVKNMKILKSCIETLKYSWFQPRNHNQIRLIEPSIKLWKNICNTFLVMAITCNTFWIIYPLLDRSVEEKRLPFLAWFPFEYKTSPLYELTFALQIFSTNYLTLVHVNIDSIISGFNVYVGCQFNMLSENLRKFSNSPGNDREYFVSCVVHHRNILGYIKKCGDFFNWILLWHLILSGVTIGITMFQLTLMVPFSNEFYSNLSYGVAIVVQIFMYCWFGNDVEIKSNLVSQAAFESDWIDLPNEMKKDLLFFIMNTLKPVRVSAFNVLHLSLDTFMKILKTAWSYFALLNQLSLQN